MSRVNLICQSDWQLIDFNVSGKTQVSGKKISVCVVC